jgi:hypothetical protein
MTGKVVLSLGGFIGPARGERYHEVAPRKWRQPLAAAMMRAARATVDLRDIPGDPSGLLSIRVKWPPAGRGCPVLMLPLQSAQRFSKFGRRSCDIIETGNDSEIGSLLRGNRYALAHAAPRDRSRHKQ